MFENSSICVFGGTGTIGSLIVDYLRTQHPTVIRIFSNDENSLWKSQQRWGNTNIRYLLGDIRNLERVRIALKGIDYVFNSAAIKHVPFAEYNPLEAVTINVLGLDNIIETSIDRGVKKILHISTDKAVEPTSIMGATKMISERLLQMRWAQNPSVDMVCVRLGNVYGSRGSIVPLIHKLKKQEQPITVTDPGMERFFMFPKEVTRFIMNVFTEGGKGEIWVPKLQQKNIMNIIQYEAGYNYPVTIIGNRHGEKLREKLLSEYETTIASETQTHWIIKNDFEVF